MTAYVTLPRRNENRNLKNNKFSIYLKIRLQIKLEKNKGKNCKLPLRKLISSNENKTLKKHSGFKKKKRKSIKRDW